MAHRTATWHAIAVGLSLALFACSRRELPAPSTHSAPPPTTALPTASSSAPIEPSPARVRIDPTSSRVTVTELPFHAVDVAAGASPSAEFPKGTLILARSGESGFVLIEWDPASSRVLREATHPFDPGSGIQVGNTRALTRTGTGFAYATTGYEDPSPIELWILGPDFVKKHHRVIHVPSVDARRLSLHGLGETLALSYCTRGEHHVVSFDVPSGKVVGRTTLGRKLALCVGFRTPLADVRVIGSTVWAVSGGLSDYQVVALSRDLRRVVSRYPVPTPGLQADARESAINMGAFPRFDATAARIAWNTRGELRMSRAEDGAPIWRGFVDSASISPGPVSAPEEMDLPIVIDPDTGAAFLGDGTWYAPDGVANRVFRVREEQPDYAPVPVQHRRLVTFAHGRAVFLGVSPEHATLALVEPELPSLDAGLR